ncbi:MAG: hypothetical protein EOO20_12845 [Chryseobacterium sp.]|nr:MAG: hypothetical protein EOO20_12845 [Chryseobacterium sp.]
MTIGNYIKSKLNKFQFAIEEAELEAELINQDLSAVTEYSKDHLIPVKKVLISIIPELLLAPDISEGDFSIKYKVDGIKAYYSLLCSDTGLPDIYNPSQDSIIDRTDVW